MAWLERLPAPILQARPRLRLYQGWALSLSGHVDVAGQILQEAKVKLQSLPPSSDNDALRGRQPAAGMALAAREEANAALAEALFSLSEMEPPSVRSMRPSRNQWYMHDPRGSVTAMAMSGLRDFR